MQVTFTANCRAMGEHFPIGATADVPEDVAKQLIAIGRAESPEVAEVFDYSTASTEPSKPKPAPSKRGTTKPTTPKED